MSSLAKLKDALGEANTTFFSLAVILCSLGVLVYDVCNTYKTNGWWIMFNFCVVAVFVFGMLEITGICSPGLNLIMKISIIHGGILTMKLMFDVSRRICGINLE